MFGSRRPLTAAGALAVAATLMAGCGSESTVDALSSMATEQAIPGYENVAQQASFLSVSFAETCPAPSAEDVDSARQQLVNLRIGLAELDAFRHGPAMDERDIGRINTVADPEAIEALIVDLDTDIFDAHYVSTSIGATKRGVYAAEYVLFKAEDMAQVAADLADPNRCQYLTAVLGAISENLDNTLVGWTDGGEIKLPYADVLANEEHGQDNLNTAVETSVFLLRDIIDMELANGLGLVGSEADLEALQEGQAGQGLARLLARLESIDQALAGDVGIGTLVDEELADRLRSEISAAQAQVENLMAKHGSSIVAAVQADPDGVTELHDLIVAVEATVATEVVGDLNVVVGFSDADGDSAN